MRLLLRYSKYTDLNQIKTKDNTLLIQKKSIKDFLEAHILPLQSDEQARIKEYNQEILNLESEIHRVRGTNLAAQNGSQLAVYNQETNDSYIKFRREKIERIKNYKVLGNDTPKFWYGDDYELIKKYKRLFTINILEILVKKECGLKIPQEHTLQRIHDIDTTLKNTKYNYENNKLDYGRKLKDFDLDDFYNLCSFNSLIDLSIVFDETFPIIDDIYQKISQIYTLNFQALLILEDYEIINYFLNISTIERDFSKFIEEFFIERNKFIDFLCDLNEEMYDYLCDHPDNRGKKLRDKFNIKINNPTVLTKETEVYNSPYYADLQIPPQIQNIFLKVMN